MTTKLERFASYTTTTLVGIILELEGENPDMEDVLSELRYVRDCGKYVQGEDGGYLSIVRSLFADCE